MPVNVGVISKVFLHMGTYEWVFIRWFMGKCVDIGFDYGVYSKETTYLG